MEELEERLLVSGVRGKPRDGDRVVFKMEPSPSITQEKRKRRQTDERRKENVKERERERERSSEEKGNEEAKKKENKKRPYPGS